MLFTYNLIAISLALVAFMLSKQLLVLFGKRRRRRTNGNHLSIPPSVKIDAATSQAKLTATPKRNLPPSKDRELFELKELFHRLHTLEYNADILPRCQELLISLLCETLADALNSPLESTILSIRDFSSENLAKFILKSHMDTTDAYEKYVARRRSGGSREMFKDVADAKWWLKQAAPVKYVDGAWLGHLNKISTPFKLRSMTKNAWQVMSEELGDGDLTKNHVHVYRELMQEIQAGLPEGDSEDFIHPRHELSEKRVWKAAVAQLLISLFPHDFLPEVLGFNMAYESLPLHLMKTVKELDELNINSYYFVLHIAIDNNDSGHSAMAMQVVLDYLELVRQEQGEEALQKAWRRVQAGYVLAEGLPTTPETPLMKAMAPQTTKIIEWTTQEKAVAEIFKRKTSASKIHCNSRLKFGDKTLSEWLDPGHFQDPHWRQAFLNILSNRRPWVVKGDSEKSKLVSETLWGGRMFGAFTESEVTVVKEWIDSLEESTIANHEAYYNFTGVHPKELDHNMQDIFTQYPAFGPCNSLQHLLSTSSSEELYSIESTKSPKQLDYSLRQDDLKRLLPLWYASSSLLENFPNVPVRVSNKAGCAVVRILRAQYGFLKDGDGVAGLDECMRTNNGQATGLLELGAEISVNTGLERPQNFTAVLRSSANQLQQFVVWLLSVSMRPLEFGDVLFGLTLAFIELHEVVHRQSSDCLSEESTRLLQNIIKSERQNLDIIIQELLEDQNRLAAFSIGLEKGRLAWRSQIESRQEPERERV